MKKLLICTLLALPLAASAQSDDFGIWAEANIEKKLNSRLSLDAGLELRTRGNVSEMDRWSAGVGLDYKLADWLKASASYTFLSDNNYKLNNSGRKYADYWGSRHRLSLSLTAQKNFGKLGISLRERWQYTYRPEQTVSRYYVGSGEQADEHTYVGRGKNVWRSRLQLKYKVDKFWRPYVSAETYVSNGLDKVRYTVGTELRLDKHSSIDVKYLFQDSYKDSDNEGNLHVLGVGYTYKF